MYKIKDNTIIKDDTLYIPMDTANSDYQEYLEWVDEGNVAELMEREVKNITTISMAQCRLMLLNLGILSQVDGLIDGMEEPQRSVAKIEWEYRDTVKIDNPLVLMFGSSLQLTEEQVQGLFNEASLL